MPFCTSYTAFVVVALFFGLFVAAYISLTSIVLVDLVRVSSQTYLFKTWKMFKTLSITLSPKMFV
jgi:hypothetical protein